MNYRATSVAKNSIHGHWLIFYRCNDSKYLQVIIGIEYTPEEGQKTRLPESICEYCESFCQNISLKCEGQSGMNLFANCFCQHLIVVIMCATFPLESWVFAWSNLDFQCEYSEYLHMVSFALKTLTFLPSRSR